MSNTYTKLYIQIVFAVSGRRNLISEDHREELQKYMTGIVQNRKHKMLAVYCMPDHVHIFFGLHPEMSISKIAQEVKAISSKFINDNKWITGKFNWQSGYGPFSYAEDDIDRVVRYINDQKKHHEKQSFKKEYLDLLKEFEIDYEEKYLFEWVE